MDRKRFKRCWGGAFREAHVRWSLVKWMCGEHHVVSTVQSFSHHIAFMPSQNFDNMKFFFCNKLLSCMIWSKDWYIILNSFDMRTLLSAVYGVHIIPSTDANPHAGMRCFATWAFVEGEIIWFYYRTLIYKTMLNHPMLLISRKEVFRWLLRNSSTPQRLC